MKKIVVAVLVAAVLGVGLLMWLFRWQYFGAYERVDRFTGRSQQLVRSRWLDN
jgi:hypothetical protein